MKIVIDTNVFISGIFFRGNPRTIIESIVGGRFDAYVTSEILEEYLEIIDRMLDKKQGKFDKEILSPLFSSLRIIEGGSKIEVCRDPDDDKFIGCAVDAKALYIVSGDKDLLDIGKYKDVQIITAKEFCDKYLK